MEFKMYRCSHCGQMVFVVKETGVPMICCGEPMQEVKAGTTDAAVEKHVPVVEVKDGKVTVSVGSVTHPMLPEHFIQWIVMETKCGLQWAKLQPGEEPKAYFNLCECDEIVAVYEYCNLHGLWKA